MTLAPLRLQAVRRSLAAYGVNQLGDWAGEIALAVGVYSLTRSAAAVAATFVAHRALLSLLSPALVAFLEPRTARPVSALYLAQALLFLALALTLRWGLLWVIPLVLLDGLLAPAARGFARALLVRSAAPHGLLRETNALLNVIFTANGVLAPIVGGSLVAAIGPGAALEADAASFLAAAGLLYRSSAPGTSAHTPDTTRGVRLALAYVRDHRLLAGLLALDVLTSLFLMAITPIEVVFVTQTLRAGNSALGAVLTAWGVGMVLGGTLVTRLSRLPVLLVLGGGTLGCAAACLGMGLSTRLPEVIAWSALGGLGNGLAAMLLVTAVQERTSDAFQARVNGLHEAALSVAAGLGYAIGGLVAEAASPRAVYFLAAAGAAGTVAAAAVALRDADWSPTQLVAADLPAAASTH